MEEEAVQSDEMNAVSVIPRTEESAAAAFLLNENCPVQ